MTDSIQFSNLQAYVREVKFVWDHATASDVYPFCLPALRQIDSIPLHPNVTFLIGENGSGKSTLVEALALAWGFNVEGGSRNFHFETRTAHSRLADCITLVKGVQRPRDGYFFRAESFYNVASEIERLDQGGGGKRVIASYGGRSLHEQSHGEAFTALFTNRFRGHGFYILDEPEAALSPMRQLATLSRLHELVVDASQFVIATHSPILMAYPNASILEFSQHGIRRIAYRETAAFTISHTFLSDPERMLKSIMQK